MRANSLAFRLIVAATLWSVIALLVASFFLASLNRKNAEAAFDDRMGVYLKTLVGALATAGPTPNAEIGNLGEPRFELLYSGWYWQARDPKGQVILSSASLFSDTLEAANLTGQKVDNGITSGALAGPLGQSLRVLSQRVTFAGNRQLDVLVAGDTGAMEAQIAEFRNSVFATLAVFGLGLVIATTIQILWGLRPLDRVRRGLTDLRSGKQARFEENLPAEIEPLVAELNALLESNREVVERARTQVGNLAHALKTPLSVITNEARAIRDPAAQKLAEQAEIMRRQVNHYLDRARIAGQVDVIGVVADVDPTISRLVRAMRRIHGERNLVIDWSGAGAARFKGEQQDLEEIVGNLVDNACKWAKGRVVVSAEVRNASGEEPGVVSILIDDDGPGLTDQQIEVASARGKRLDETKPGSGLGLSIVSDLVGMYKGTLTLSRAPIGGLRAVVVLPAAQ